MAPGSEWLGIQSGGSGTNSGTVQVLVQSNLAATARTGTVVVTAPGAVGSPASVRVVQSGRPVLSVTPAVSNTSSMAGTAVFSVANLGGPGMAYAAAVAHATAYDYGLRSATGMDSGTIYLDYEFNLPGQQIQVEVTAPGAQDSPCTVTLQGPSGRRKARAAAGGSMAGEPDWTEVPVPAPVPVTVVTSDDVSPVFASGWAAVDGDLETIWEGQAPGGGFLAVRYEPGLELRALEVELAEDSLPGMECLYSPDGETWQPLPEDLDVRPVGLQYLWLVFPDDGTDAVPRVREILPRP